MILLDHYGMPVPLDTLRQDSGLSQNGTTAIELLRLARRYGLEAKAYSRDIDGLADLGFPLIVQTDFNHMMVVEGITATRVQVNDPAVGPADLPLSEFSERFTGIVLLMRPPQGFALHRPPLTRALNRLRRDWGPVWQAIRPVRRRQVLLNVSAAGILTLLTAITVALAAMEILPPLPALALTTVLLAGRSLLLAMTGPPLTDALRDAACQTLAAQPGRYFSMRGPDRILGQVMALISPGQTLGGKTGARALDLLLLPVFLTVLPFSGPALLGLACIGLTGLAALPLLVAVSDRTAPWRRFSPQELRLPGLDGQALTRDTDWAFSGQRSSLWASLNGSAAQTVLNRHRADRALRRASAGPVLMMACVSGLGWAGPLPPPQALLTLFCLFCLWRLTDTLPSLIQMQRTAPALSDLLAPPVPSPPAPGGDSLKVSGLTFSYRPDGPPLFAGLSLTLTAPQQISLTGPSGCGKSTLLRILAGLDCPGNGTLLRPHRIVLLDGQEPFPAGSLRDSLSLSGAIPADDRRIEQALRRAEAWPFLSHRGGLDASIPDGAVTFSGGQRRRLALARALLTDPTLILVDEAFDSLDPALEQRVRHALRDAGIGLVTVTQRPESLRMADQALTLTAAGFLRWQEDGAALPQAVTETTPLPPAEAAPLSDQDRLTVQETARHLTGRVPDQLSLPQTGLTIRTALLHSGVLTRRIRLRPEDQPQRSVLPLLIRSAGRWRLLPGPGPVRMTGRVTGQAETEALAPHPVSLIAPPLAPLLWRTTGLALLLCLPAALAGALILAGATAATSALLAAATACSLLVDQWLRSRNETSLLKAHASLWSWLLFLPLPVLRKERPERVDPWLPDWLDTIRAGLPALTTLPPLLTAAGIAAAGSSLLPVILPLAGITLLTAIWYSHRLRVLHPRSLELRRSLSQTLGALLSLRLLSADIAALTHWRQNQQALDRRQWPAHLGIALADLGPLLLIFAGLIAPGLATVPLPALCLAAVVLAVALRHGRGLAAAAVRHPVLFAGHRNALPAPPSRSPLTLTAENLAFTLPGAPTPLIAGMAAPLTLRPGTITALCGPSGCGKTTLTRLLTGIMTPHSGGITLNGLSADTAMLEDLQSRTGWLEQDDRLPVGTVRSLVSGNGAASEADCWQALHAVGMADTIAALPMGLQAVISGTSLPAGHGRLLALAQVMLTRPALLILDEALSGLEGGRLPGLLGMIRQSGCACLLVTHRPDILPLADAAWEIRDGVVRPILSAPNSAGPYHASGH